MDIYYKKYIKYKKKYLDLKGGSSPEEIDLVPVYNICFNIIKELINYIIYLRSTKKNITIISVGNTPYKMIKALETSFSHFVDYLDFHYVPFSGRLFSVSDNIVNVVKVMNGTFFKIPGNSYVFGFEFNSLDDYNVFDRSIREGVESISIEGYDGEYGYRKIRDSEKPIIRDLNKSKDKVIIISKALGGSDIDTSKMEDLESKTFIRVKRSPILGYSSRVHPGEIYAVEFPSVDAGNPLEFVKGNFLNYSILEDNNVYTDDELAIFKEKLPEFSPEKIYVFVDFTETGVGFASFLYLCKAVTPDFTWDNKYIFSINDDYNPEGEGPPIARFSYYANKLLIPQVNIHFAQIKNMSSSKWYDVFPREILNDRCVKSWRKSKGEWNRDTYLTDNPEKDKCEQFITSLVSYIETNNDYATLVDKFL